MLTTQGEGTMAFVVEMLQTWDEQRALLKGTSPPALALLSSYLKSLSTKPTPNSSVPASLFTLARDSIASLPYSEVPDHLRRLYTDSAILWCLSDLLQAELFPERIPADASFWESVVARLDLTLIVAKSPGRNRLVHRLIRHVQVYFLPPLVISDVPLQATKRQKIQPVDMTPLLVAPNHILVLPRPPSITEYLSRYLNTPFIIRSRNSLLNWSAIEPISVENWNRRAHIEEIAGRGRIVPVEVGGDYTREGWGQKLISFSQFLDIINFDAAASQKQQDQDHAVEKELLYLAQHDLFVQFPELRDGITLPEYVYSSPPVVEEEEYRPPENEDGVLINTWLGGEGVSSPAHTDPYYNNYVQVFGHKRVVLFPPHHHLSMYPFTSPSPSSSSSTSSTPVDPSSSSTTTGFMSNTSSLSLFTTSLADLAQTHPRFEEEALPDAVEEVLRDGDMLVLPKGWWHALRQEDGPGWGVSFWY